MFIKVNVLSFKIEVLQRSCKYVTDIHSQALSYSFSSCVAEQVQKSWPMILPVYYLMSGNVTCALAFFKMQTIARNGVPVLAFHL